MEQWQKILRQSITSPTGLARSFPVDIDMLNQVTAIYPMRLNGYYAGLIKEKNDPIWKQSVPSTAELEDDICFEDPLNEEALSPVPNLVHKYPDRVLFLVHNQCAVYCRFCTRKRKVGTGAMAVTDETIRAGIDYIARTPEIRDVLVSGGDPLLLDDEKLDLILTGLRSIPSVRIIRIGSRVPCTLPMRVTVRLARLLKKFHPLYINTHFNHPREITPLAARACKRLADAGIPLGSQTVLLRGVNDDIQTISELMYGLLSIRVKPYYLFQTDMTRGTNHFRTQVESGIAIMKGLIGHISGMAVPTFAVDAPGGGGKIPLLPDYVRQLDDELLFESYCGKICSYKNIGNQE